MCASSPPSDAVFQSATRAIEAAERAGAEDLSPVELRFARERLAQARTLADQGQSEEALMAMGPTSCLYVNPEDLMP